MARPSRVYVIETLEIEYVKVVYEVDAPNARVAESLLLMALSNPTPTNRSNYEQVHVETLLGAQGSSNQSRHGRTVKKVVSVKRSKA